MNGKSGKLVAPAVAFMLCAVALIGVGFAISLNSTSTADNNTVNVNGVVLNLIGDGEDKTTITGTAAVYYETVQTGANGPIVYNFADSDMTIAAGSVTIMSPGNVTLTYTLTNVKVKLANGTEATAIPVLKMESFNVQNEGGVYTLSKENVESGTYNFTILLDGRNSGSIGGASTSNLPATITYDLSVSAVYDTA